MTRKTSPRVAASPGCRPFFEMYEWARTAKPSRWPQVEDRFLAAMWEFDQAFTAGLANQGDNQNGKGDFFTDLIALLLNASGTGYQSCKMQPHLELDRVLTRVCTALRNLP